ncbi:Response regulator receiver domain-containing protein [Desulfomicrobium norvegicum]|uniref:Response regulator receiver domain-containing protein n=1 Tax=Desulfomicrobium norvegicum (strain DSM 1741 / NCIMB 8310) TaxID=52561 RepID=A0A8G2C1P2_DESNO|nr:response regulator [Desulfomicrobium norvegicum]SFL53316.1 Response regulator receiver domain-containing protein [Desulfomicrobium norvegicum]
MSENTITQSTVTVLVLDDEPNIRESLAEYLMDCGFGTLTAESAEDALELPELGDVAVAVVDIRLGGIDGLEFIKRLHVLHPSVRCLIHTGSTDFQLDNELRTIGLTEREVLFKPVLDMGIFETLILEKVAEGRS